MDACSWALRKCHESSTGHPCPKTPRAPPLFLKLRVCDFFESGRKLKLETNNLTTLNPLKASPDYQVSDYYLFTALYLCTAYIGTQLSTN